MIMGILAGLSALVIIFIAIVATIIVSAWLLTGLEDTEEEYEEEN